MRTGVLFASAIGALAVSSAWAQQSPQPDRVALARQLVEMDRPGLGNGKSVDAIVKAVKAARTYETALSCGATCAAPELDEVTFEASLNSGARVAIAESNAALIRIYAEALSADDLTSVLAFFRSTQGQAAMRANAAAWEEMMAKPVVERAQTLQYQPTPDEAAFLATPAGHALKAASDQPAIKYGESDLLQSAVEATEADYCSKLHCDGADRQLFKMMDVTFNPYRAHREHAMFGDTAGDLFPKPNDASLSRAACVGDTDGIVRALKAGANVNAEGAEGVGPGAVRMTVTPLIWAISCNSPAGIAALLDVGADPNRAEKLGATPVTIAAANDDPAMLEILLKRGGDPNAHNDRTIALEEAVDAAHDLERVRKVPKALAWRNWEILIDGGADPFRMAPNGRPLIDRLIFDNDLDRVEQLMDRGWTGDPVALGRTIETKEEAQRRVNRTPNPEELATIDRIKGRLQMKGVRFPIGPLARLQKDSRGFYVQP